VSKRFADSTERKQLAKWRRPKRSVLNPRLFRFAGSLPPLSGHLRRLRSRHLADAKAHGGGTLYVSVSVRGEVEH
jgi:hypothetical protein